MATTTEKLGLIKPDPTDYYNVEAFNQNMEKIDEAAGKSGLPTGGTDGQVLLKDGATEGAAKWGDVQALPAGGTTGQVLVKTSDADGEATWDTLYSYGTEDLEAGVSELATGKLYFVYE